jgi:hypothetical protein
VGGYLSVSMLDLDPPDHTRLRKLVNKAFTARRVAGLRPRVEAITSSLLDAMAARAAAGEAEVDLIEALAFPLPITVICELLGIPASDQESFQAWSHTVVSSVGSQEESHAAGIAMHRYFTDLVAAKREAPADDLLSALIATRDSGDSLDERELIAMMLLLHPRSRVGAVRDVVGEPRSGALRRPRPTGPGPRRGRPPGVRARDPLLPRSAAGPAGGRGGVRRAAGPFPWLVARGPSLLAPVASQQPHPRA